jgi:glycosyltransferase involved in cell wall biosynthesis
MFNKKQKVIFYAQVYFFDAALEYLKIASQFHDLHVFIEISPKLLKSNVFDISTDLANYPDIIDFYSVIQNWKLNHFVKYFENCASVSFVNHKSDNSILKSIKVSSTVLKSFKKINPDFYHFDYLSLRQIGLIPYLFFRKSRLIINIHDPKPHSGEYDLKNEVLRKLSFVITDRFVVFSEYSRKELSKIISSHKNIHLLKLLPYSIFNSFIEPDFINEGQKYISIIGRISPYKGTHLFIEASQRIIEKFPDQLFCIAGKPIDGYTLPEIEPGLAEKTRILQGHLSNKEIARIISESILVVCPYIDATQSGVIMTAYSLKCPVLATNVGGLSEYVTENITGSIVDSIDSESIAERIIQLISNGDMFKMKEIMKNPEYIVEKDISYNRYIISELYK